jgi:hypothetical protein
VAELTVEQGDTSLTFIIMQLADGKYTPAIQLEAGALTLSIKIPEGIVQGFVKLVQDGLTQTAEQARTLNTGLIIPQQTDINKLHNNGRS